MRWRKSWCREPTLAFRFVPGILRFCFQGNWQIKRFLTVLNYLPSVGVLDGIHLLCHDIPALNESYGINKNGIIFENEDKFRKCNFAIPIAIDGIKEFW